MASGYNQLQPSTGKTTSLERLWTAVEFAPNNAQEKAIRHSGGPLYLPAGPGSGKTKVILWRTVDLIVFRGVAPEEIFLSTFTEKAAFRLREGLRALLGVASNYTDIPYDISRMYVGTVHSLCQRLIMDRRFYKDRQPTSVPSLLDELAQYFHISNQRRWDELVAASGLGQDEAKRIINQFLSDYPSESRHQAACGCMALFNRLSEECIDCSGTVLNALSDETLKALIKMCGAYRRTLQEPLQAPLVDFSLLQTRALETLRGFSGGGDVFKHVIVDEYQDTNTIQELLFFQMASGSKNITVVGDDDQALYRFRGATVENFVEFPDRCEKQLGVRPEKIPLSTNYRSRKQIVTFYTKFMQGCNWKAAGENKYYRVIDKNITAHNDDDKPSVIATSPTTPEKACREIAELVTRLIREKKVDDPNQVAFLFPSFKFRGQLNMQVQRMKRALEDAGLRVYAPRAGRFLETEEAVAIFGILLRVFGKPNKANYGGADYANFHGWMDASCNAAEDLEKSDPHLKQFIEDRRHEIAQAITDLQTLSTLIQKHKWDLKAPYHPDVMKRPLYSAAGLSEKAKRSIVSSYFDLLVRKRIKEGQPFSLNSVVRRATSLDWSLLDLFYRICGFNHFKAMFALAQTGEDEGPVCNLGLISQYISRYMDEYMPIMTGAQLAAESPKRLLFMSYLFALYRLGESEYEDSEDPFPKGRIPFLTIHQAKGLEFPVVVLGNLRKDDRGPQRIEEIVRPLLPRDGEPLGRTSEFDIMRMFYVALSRAKNLLVLAHYKGQGIRVNEPFKTMLNGFFPRIPNFKLDSLPSATVEADELPRNYSYTSDYLLYQTCPRKYMVFRKYGFVPSRSQTMLFGSVVHRTLDDLHQLLISQRAAL